MPTKLASQRRAGPFKFCASIICTIIAFATIIFGLVLLVGYVMIHPRKPFIGVLNAHLNYLHYHAIGGMLESEIIVVLRAENDNALAHASFSDSSFVLGFHGVRVAKLVAGPFDVKKNSSVDFNYVVRSSSIVVDPEVMQVVDNSLRRNEIMYELRGDSKTQWRVGPLGSFKLPCHLNCQLHFHPLNGSYIRSRCTSRS